MINVTIKGACVSYETLKDAQTASTDQGLAFWRETLEICERDDGAWNDLLNELSDSGGESEAETLDEIFCSPAMRRWVLVALVLNGLTDSDYGRAIKDIANKDYDQLINWLECRQKTLEGADAASVKAELAYWQGIVDQIREERERAIAKRKAEDAKKRRERKERQRAEAERIRLEEEQKKAARADAARRKREREAERARQEMVRLAAAQAEAERQRKEKEAAERKRQFLATATYMVVDLASANSCGHCRVTFLEDVPNGGWTNSYKTTKLVLRRINAGSFMMGSPAEEDGRNGDEMRRNVSLTKPFYIGIFPLTNSQWNCIRGSVPSQFTDDTIPVQNVSYFDVRGAYIGSQWPWTKDVDANSFMGTLRSITGIDFDLSTEAQWEYACRAGTKTPYSFGKSLSWASANYGGGCKCLKEVGLYKPNAWGLYDMHGNIQEWCLDWYGTYLAETNDPTGPESGDNRVVRGGDWIESEKMCRSACRDFCNPSQRSIYLGFRVCCSAAHVARMVELYS